LIFEKRNNVTIELKKRKLFITGATGFIGNHLLNEICDYIDSLVIYSLPYEKINVGENIKIIHSLLEFGQKVDYVVHLAARVHQMNENIKDSFNCYQRVNVDFALDVAKKAIENGVKKFVFISSVKVYGNKPGYYSLDDVPQPDDPYGVSKYEAEQKLQKLFIGKSSKLIILRLPMVYGSGNKGNMLALLKYAKKKIPLPLKAANKKRSFVYVKNVVSAIIRCLEKDIDSERMIYNLADENDYSSNELYSALSLVMVNRKLSFYFPVIVLKFLSILSKKFRGIYLRLFEEYRFSKREFYKDYDWKPPFEFNEAIKETVLNL
jgi:nucleoside-diphosphate-sugar epimerase